MRTGISRMSRFHEDIRNNNPNHLIMNQPLLKKLISLGSQPHRALLIASAWIMLIFSAYAQTAVTGRITAGEDAAPLPGVNILVKGTAEGTISDADGKYSISVPSSESVLVFSFVGYLSQEVAISGRTSIDVTLASDAHQLSEVVVTALGIEKDKSKLGYAVQDVKGV